MSAACGALGGRVAWCSSPGRLKPGPEEACGPVFRRGASPLGITSGVQSAPARLPWPWRGPAPGLRRPSLAKPAELRLVADMDPWNRQV